MVASIQDRAQERRRAVAPTKRQIGAQASPGDHIAGTAADAEQQRRADRG
jgi:hypothetical protein